MSQFDRAEGRRLFGTDPDAYDRARPGHPDRVYDVLVARCGLGPETSVLEIGPGTGQATRRLLELGADPLVVVEPDPVLAGYLRRRFGPRIGVSETTLEDAALPHAGFDLAVAASAFHWVDEPAGLAKIAHALRPGGWIGLWWTLFGEGAAPDDFIRATSPLLEGLSASPSRGGHGGQPYALDVPARLEALAAAGFEDAEHELARWSASWDASGIRALYGTFSPIARLEEEKRLALLDEIERIADSDFGGHVERTLVTSLYTAGKARRPSA